MATHRKHLIDQLVGLGQKVERRARRIRYGSRAFSEIVTASLDEAKPSVASLNELLSACFAHHTLPAQRRVDEGFGQPSVTVYRRKHFTVDLLFWQTATTGIHQHQFAGAFSLLWGSSLHTQFRFQRQRALSRSLLQGALSVRSVEILRRGDVRPIVPGNGLIHSLFHLDSPSVTLAIRSLPSGRSSPEYEYLPPNLAIDPRARDDQKQVQKQLLTLAARHDRQELERHLRGLLNTSDFHAAYLLLARARREFGEDARYRRLIGVARRRHGADINALLPAIEQEWRRDGIVTLRSTVVNPKHRLFLALLLNLPDLESICAALSLLDPDGNPVEDIIEQVSELSVYDWFGMDFHAPHATVLGGLLQRQPVERIAQTYSQQFPTRPRKGTPLPFNETCASLIASPLLEPLFK